MNILFKCFSVITINLYKTTGKWFKVFPVMKVTHIALMRTTEKLNPNKQWAFRLNLPFDLC